MGTFAEELDRIMTRRRISNKALASKIPSSRGGKKTTESYIWLLRKGQREPGETIARAIAEHLGNCDGPTLWWSYLLDNTPAEVAARLTRDERLLNRGDRPPHVEAALARFEAAVARAAPGPWLDTLLRAIEREAAEHPLSNGATA